MSRVDWKTSQREAPELPGEVVQSWKRFDGNLLKTGSERP